MTPDDKEVTKSMIRLLRWELNRYTVDGKDAECVTPQHSGTLFMLDCAIKELEHCVVRMT